MIRLEFKNFCNHHNYLDIEQALDCFAFFGAVDRQVDIDFFDDLYDVIINNFLLNIRSYESHISPSFLQESPYRDLLMAIARGDGKLLNIFKRSKLGEVVGSNFISQLVDLGILRVEKSREKSLKIHPKQKIKKNLRSYRIQSKARFVSPFFRFWFGFVEPYIEEIYKGENLNFIKNYRSNYDKIVSLNFEQLSNDLLELHYSKIDPILSSGSFWDHHSEFDLLCVTQSGKVILGECKYRGRKVCKNELNKLKEKAINSSIRVDTYALFSKNGFSNELIHSEDSDLILFELKDFKKL